jgi:hypothetical protein
LPSPVNLDVFRSNRPRHRAPGKEEHLMDILPPPLLPFSSLPTVTTATLRRWSPPTKLRRAPGQSIARSSLLTSTRSSLALLRFLESSPSTGVSTLPAGGHRHPPRASACIHIDASPQNTVACSSLRRPDSSPLVPSTPSTPR